MVRDYVQESMFTGLIEQVGVIQQVLVRDGGARLIMGRPDDWSDLVLGESIAVNGCCLTVAEMDSRGLAFDLLQETLNRTNLGALEAGARVNLERALAVGARLGGHFVQGHIDCRTNVTRIEALGADLGITFAVDARSGRYLVEKGSIAVNGVSLTVAALLETGFSVWVIPHTQRETNLGDLRVGAEVNLEFDLLAKYTERLLGAQPR